MLYDIMEPESPSLQTNLAVGIDFGTTNSLIAFIRDGVSVLIPDEDGQILLPSVVAYEDGKTIVGKQAERCSNHISSIKRLLGKTALDFSDKDIIYRAANQVSYDDAGEIIIQMGDLKKPVIAIAADIIKALKTRAERFTNTVISDAVITVPTYFDDGARNAVKVAAQLAGFNVMRLINEPTAAAYAYGLEEGPEGMYMVYDLGGGTFDVSILRMQKGVFQVISTAGDNNLGGDDFDLSLAEFICGQQKIDIKQLCKDELKSLLQSARNIKQHLSTHDTWDDGKLSINRQQLEGLIEPHFKRTMVIVKKAIKDAGLSNIDKLILVGGATRVPYIKNNLSKEFVVIDGIGPETIVVQGAAMKASSLQSGSGGGLLIDVIPLSLGIELADGINEIIIPRNTPIPALYNHTFTTGKDNQTGFVIHIVQGESQDVRLCRSLAKFHLNDLPSFAAGVIKVQISLQIDADGILTVTARELTTDKLQQVVVKPSYGLSQDELLRLRSQA